MMIWKNETGKKQALSSLKVKEVEIVDFSLQKAAKAFVKSAQVVSIKKAVQIAYACGISKTRMWTVD